MALLIIQGIFNLSPTTFNLKSLPKLEEINSCIIKGLGQIGLIILICKVINKAIKSLKQDSLDLENAINKLKELGYSTSEITNMKNISLYDEILLNSSK